MFEHCDLWKVVISTEEQYSIWPVSKVVPSGWSEKGKEGTKEECLTYINEVWVDMRPRSLRELMHNREVDSNTT